jgi:hypothetical protein
MFRKPAPCLRAVDWVIRLALRRIESVRRIVDQRWRVAFRAVIDAMLGEGDTLRLELMFAMLVLTIEARMLDAVDSMDRGRLARRIERVGDGRQLDRLEDVVMVKLHEVTMAVLHTD